MQQSNRLGKSVMDFVSGVHLEIAIEYQRAAVFYLFCGPMSHHAAYALVPS
jgi:hypothetical protein